MQKVKQEVSKLLNPLPDDCSLEDVQYHSLCSSKD